MAVKREEHYVAPGGTVEILVTSGGKGTLFCGKTPMILKGASSKDTTINTSRMKKLAEFGRYRHGPSGIEIVVIKPGNCALRIDGRFKMHRNLNCVFGVEMENELV